MTNMIRLVMEGGVLYLTRQIHIWGGADLAMTKMRARRPLDSDF